MDAGKCDDDNKLTWQIALEAAVEDALGAEHASERAKKLANELRRAAAASAEETSSSTPTTIVMSRVPELTTPFTLFQQSCGSGMSSGGQGRAGLTADRAADGREAGEEETNYGGGACFGSIDSWMSGIDVSRLSQELAAAAATTTHFDVNDRINSTPSPPAPHVSHLPPPLLPVSSAVLVGILDRGGGGGVSSSAASSPLTLNGDANCMSWSLRCKRHRCAAVMLCTCEPPAPGVAIVATRWRWLPCAPATGAEDLIEIDAFVIIDHDRNQAGDIHAAIAETDGDRGVEASAHRNSKRAGKRVSFDTRIESVSPIFETLGGMSLVKTTDGYDILLKGRAHAEWHYRLSQRFHVVPPSSSQTWMVRFTDMVPCVLFRKTERERRVYCPTAASEMAFILDERTSPSPTTQVPDQPTNEDDNDEWREPGMEERDAQGFWCTYTGELTSIACDGLLLILDGGVKVLMTHFPSTESPHGIRIGASLLFVNLYWCRGSHSDTRSLKRKRTMANNNSSTNNNTVGRRPSPPSHHFLVATSRTEVKVLHFSPLRTPQFPLWTSKAMDVHKKYCESLTAWRALTFVSALHALRLKFSTLSSTSLGRVARRIVSTVLREWLERGYVHDTSISKVDDTRIEPIDNERDERGIDIYSEFFDGRCDRFVSTADPAPVLDVASSVHLPLVARMGRQHDDDIIWAGHVDIRTRISTGGGVSTASPSPLVVLVCTIESHEGSLVVRDDTGLLPVHMSGLIHSHRLGCIQLVRDFAVAVGPMVAPSVHIHAHDLQPLLPASVSRRSRNSIGGGPDTVGVGTPAPPSSIDSVCDVLRLAILQEFSVKTPLKWRTQHAGEHTSVVLLRVLMLNVRCRVLENRGFCRLGDECLCGEAVIDGGGGGINAALIVKSDPWTRRVMQAQIDGDTSSGTMAMIEIRDPPSGLMASFAVGEMYLVPDTQSAAERARLTSMTGAQHTCRPEVEKVKDVASSADGGIRAYMRFSGATLPSVLCVRAASRQCRAMKELAESTASATQRTAVLVSDHLGLADRATMTRALVSNASYRRYKEARCDPAFVAGELVTLRGTVAGENPVAPWSSGAHDMYGPVMQQVMYISIHDVQVSVQKSTLDGFDDDEDTALPSSRHHPTSGDCPSECKLIVHADVRSVALVPGWAVRITNALRVGYDTFVCVASTRVYVTAVDTREHVLHHPTHAAVSGQDYRQDEHQQVEEKWEKEIIQCSAPPPVDMPCTRICEIVAAHRGDVASSSGRPIRCLCARVTEVVSITVFRRNVAANLVMDGVEAGVGGKSAMAIECVLLLDDGTGVARCTASGDHAWALLGFTLARDSGGGCKHKSVAAGVTAAVVAGGERGRVVGPDDMIWLFDGVTELLARHPTGIQVTHRNSFASEYGMSKSTHSICNGSGRPLPCFNDLVLLETLLFSACQNGMHRVDSRIDSIHRSVVRPYGEAISVTAM